MLENCASLHAHANELHEEAKSVMESAARVGQYDPTFNARLRTVIELEKVALEVEGRIEEDC